MNHQDVIEWKIAQLLEGKTDDSEMSRQMSEYVSKHMDLQEELVFTESFYTLQAASIEPPTELLRHNFYQMLDKQHGKTNWLEMIKRWLAPNPFPQFVALAAVFYLGFSFNSDDQKIEQIASNSADRLVTLEQEITSLT